MDQQKTKIINMFNDLNTPEDMRESDKARFEIIKNNPFIDDNVEWLIDYLKFINQPQFTLLINELIILNELMTK